MSASESIISIGLPDVRPQLVQGYLTAARFVDSSGHQRARNLYSVMELGKVVSRGPNTPRELPTLGRRHLVQEIA